MEGGIYVCVLFVFVCHVHSFVLHSSVPVKYKDSAQVQITTSYSGTRIKRSGGRVPEQLNIRIHNDKISQNLTLQWLQQKDVFFPVYVDNQLHTNISFNPTLAEYYTCIDNDCLFHIEQTVSSNKLSSLKTRLYGTFHIEGQIHILEATDDDQHRITVPDLPLYYSTDNIGEQDEEGKFKMNQHARHKRATGNYEVELLMVIDYSAYQFWFTEKNNNRQDAIEAIKQFYAFMITGVNLRYQNLPGATYNIAVKNAGLYIIEDATSASFIENLKSCQTSRCTAESTAVLTAFRDWKQTTTGIPPHDHAMLFTRYDITIQGVSSATGFAFLGQICTSSSVSVIEEDFNFISQTVAAHELAHSLSAVHDGIGNSCPSSEHNIMAATSSAVSGAAAQNPWKFSTCTTQEINNLLNGQTSNSAFCLKTTVSTNHQILSNYLSQNIGQLYTPDQQCQLVLGSSSYACRSSYVTAGSFESVCTGLWCANPNLNTQCSMIIPAERTSCGSQKWCEDYQCVFSAQAPQTSANCVLGDQSGLVVNGLTCSALISQAPFSCYDTAVDQQCCNACNAVRIGITGCEFGDRLDCSSLNSYGCYSGNNGNNCCNKCRPYLTTIPGCLYGDKGDCSQVTLNWHCYGNGDTCCQTCNAYKTNIAGCEYGDRASNCDVTLCLTYSDTDKNLCCSTCNGITPPVTTQAPTQETTTTTQTSGGSELPAWVIPVAASVGGLLLILSIIGIACCIVSSRKHQHDNARDTRQSNINGARRAAQPVYRVSSKQRQLPVRQLSRDVIVMPHPAPQRGHRYVNNGYSRY